MLPGGMGKTFAGLFESSLGCNVTVTEVRDLGAVEAEEARGMDVTDGRKAVSGGFPP